MITEDDVHRIAESVWSMILGLDLQRSPTPGDERGHERTLTASVQISGAFEGVVNLRCSAALGERVARGMFRRRFDLAKRDAQVRDALGEVANMVGGNVKALGPEPCHLSFPTVVDGVGYTVVVPGRTRALVQLSLTSAGEPCVLTVLQRDVGEAS